MEMNHHDRLDAFRGFIWTLRRLEFFEAMPKMCWCEKESHLGVGHFECTVWFIDGDGNMRREVHCL